MEQLFSAGKAYLKINSLVKTPLHEFMAVERSGLWAPGITKMAGHSFPVSLGLPRWRPCQIPDPKCLNVKIPTQGKARSVNFPWVRRCERLVVVGSGEEPLIHL